jgi:hypothetical protein
MNIFHIILLKFTPYNYLSLNRKHSNLASTVKIQVWPYRKPVNGYGPIHFPEIMIRQCVSALGFMKTEVALFENITI